MTFSFRQNLVLLWQCADGHQVTQFLPTVANPAPILGPLSDVVDAAQACSDAGLLAVYLQPVSLISASPTAGQPYGTSRDRATFACSAGSQARDIRIVAPKSSIFTSDHRTVDLANANVAAFVSSVTSYLSTNAGSPITKVNRAYRSRTITSGSE